MERMRGVLLAARVGRGAVQMQLVQLGRLKQVLPAAWVLVVCSTRVSSPQEDMARLALSMLCKECLRRPFGNVGYSSRGA